MRTLALFAIAGAMFNVPAIASEFSVHTLRLPTEVVEALSINNKVHLVAAFSATGEGKLPDILSSVIHSTQDLEPISAASTCLAWKNKTVEACAKTLADPAWGFVKKYPSILNFLDVYAYVYTSPDMGNHDAKELELGKSYATLARFVRDALGQRIYTEIEVFRQVGEIEYSSTFLVTEDLRTAVQISRHEKRI
jgi:hypothetical protein